MSPLSFLVLIICVFIFLFFVSLAKGLSILLIFFKNQLLVSLIFFPSIVFLYMTSLPFPVVLSRFSILGLIFSP